MNSNNSASETSSLRRSYSKKKQYVASAAAAIGSFGMGNVTSWSSPALDQIKKDFDGSDEQMSWVASILTIGAIFSGLFAGFLLEKFGRKKSIHILFGPFIFGWLLVLFAHNLEMMYAGRFILGACAGAQPLMMPIYVSEIVDESIRGLCTGFFAIAAASGILITYVVGSWVSWWTLSLLSTFVPIIGLISLFFIPESPSYLLKHGEKSQAREVLVWLKGEHSGLDSELEKLQKRTEDMALHKASWNDFIAAEVYKPLIIVLVIMFVQQFSGVNSTVFYASKIFDSAKALDSEVCSIIIAAVNLGSCIICMQFMDRIGRKIMFIISALGVAVAMIGLGVYFYIQAFQKDAVEGISWLPLASLVVFNLFFTAGLGPVPFIYMAEALPSRLIGTAAGFSVSFNWALAFIVTKFFDDMRYGLGDYGCFWLYASTCVFGAIFVLFIPETKGKTLQAIQQHFH